MAFKEIQPQNDSFPPTLDFVEDSPVEGIFLHAKPQVTRFGEKLLYTLAQDDGEEVVFWGSAVLDSKLAQVDSPAMVRITYHGKNETNNGSVKLFTVEVDEDWKPETGDDIPF